MGRNKIDRFFCCWHLMGVSFLFFLCISVIIVQCNEIGNKGCNLDTVWREMFELDPKKRLYNEIVLKITPWGRLSFHLIRVLWMELGLPIYEAMSYGSAYLPTDLYGIRLIPLVFDQSWIWPKSRIVYNHLNCNSNKKYVIISGVFILFKVEFNASYNCSEERN